MQHFKTSQCSLWLKKGYYWPFRSSLAFLLLAQRAFEILVGKCFNETPQLFFSALSFSVTLLIFNFLTLWFCNFFVRHTTICLQVEELATIEFYWLGGGEMLTCCSTLHCRFFLGHKHPIELLLCCPMELFLKICQM